MKGVKRLEFSFCHCEEGTQVTDAAIHRVSEDAGGLSLRVVRTSGSPRLKRLAMTRVVWCVVFVIARRERSEGRGNPSYLGGGRTGLRFAYWLTVDRHGLTPSR